MSANNSSVWNLKRCAIEWFRIYIFALIRRASMMKVLSFTSRIGLHLYSIRITRISEIYNIRNLRLDDIYEHRKYTNIQNMWNCDYLNIRNIRICKIFEYTEYTNIRNTRIHEIIWIRAIYEYIKYRNIRNLGIYDLYECTKYKNIYEIYDIH